MSGARGDFVASLPRRLEVLRSALRAVEDQPRDADKLNGLLRRLHALGSAARVLGFASVAEALGEAEKTLRRAGRAGPSAAELGDIGRALDLLPSLLLGAKVSVRPGPPAENVSVPAPDFPLSVLIFGPPSLADLLTESGDVRVEQTEDPAKARELSRVSGPDVTVVDADRKGARELVELFVKDQALEPLPIVVVGDFASPEVSATFIGLGAARVLPKPVSPDVLRRTLLELRDTKSPPVHAREPLGEINVSELVDRIAVELRRGLVEAVEPASRTAAVGFGEGTDVMSAVWGAVARLRELVTLRSDGSVRFEPTGPEGAVPFAPWHDQRRVGERGVKDGRAGDGVSLRGRRVVVADDDPAVVWFLSGILKAVGAEVFEAHDGERAFELTASLWPDLVVSDVLMPRLDGFSLCAEIKRDVAVRDVPVVLLSWKEDLLQRVRELGGDADGYLRKEAAASTVVERLREVLRPRARVEQRVASGGEVRGRLDGLTPRLVLELACRAKRDVRVSFRDSSYLYEVQIRGGAPRTASRSAADGSFERGEPVLAMLLGVSAGRFGIQPDSTPCRAELSGSLHEQLAAPVARARAAQKALSAGALANVTRVAFDTARVGAYLECTPEPAQGLLRELLTGASPRELLTSGRAPARLLEAVLSDFARRGGVLLVETAGGIEDISQTRVPPAAEVSLPALPLPEPTPAPEALVAPVDDAKPSREAPEEAPDAADASWFSFQIEPSAAPPEAALEPAPALKRSEDPLRKTLTSSSAPPEAEDVGLPGSSVPVERGHRPDQRSETLGSAGNEAAAALTAVAKLSEVEVVEPAPEEARREEPSPVIETDDPLAQALLDTPAAPVVAEEPKPLAQTLPLVAEKPAPEAAVDASTQPPKAAPRPAKSVAKSKPATPPAPAPEPDSGGLGKTIVLAALAAGLSYFGVTKLFGGAEPPREAASPAESPKVVPTPKPVASVAPAVSKLALTITDSPLPAVTDVPAGNGLLEIAVPEGTAIRVDGEYLGMGPARRVPLPPGEHTVALGDAPPQPVTIKLGQRTLASAGAKAPSPAGSP